METCGLATSGHRERGVKRYSGLGEGKDALVLREPARLVGSGAVGSPPGWSLLTPLILLHTAPDPASINSCVITSGGHEVTLAWSCPEGGYEAFELEFEGQPGPQNSSSCGSAVKVSLLRPAQSFSATVTTVWDEMRAPSASVACHVESGHAGERSPGERGLVTFSPDLFRPCSEAGLPAWGVLFACVLSPAFFKTALLRCDSCNIQQFTH